MNAVEAKLVDWIRARHEEEGEVSLDETTDVFGAGLLDSLGFVALIALIEEMSGRQIDVDSVEPDRLRSVADIVAFFFPEAGAEPVTTQSSAAG